MSTTARLDVIDAASLLRRVWARRAWWWLGSARVVQELRAAHLTLLDVAVEVHDEPLRAAVASLDAALDAASGPAVLGWRALQLWRQRDPLRKVIEQVSALEERMAALPRAPVPPLEASGPRRSRSRTARSSSARVITAG